MLSKYFFWNKSVIYIGPESLTSGTISRLTHGLLFMAYPIHNGVIIFPEDAISFRGQKTWGPVVMWWAWSAHPGWNKVNWFAPPFWRPCHFHASAFSRDICISESLILWLYENQRNYRRIEYIEAGIFLYKGWHSIVHISTVEDKS